MNEKNEGTWAIKKFPGMLEKSKNCQYKVCNVINEFSGKIFQY